MAVRRGLVIGVLVSAGFLLVFGPVGMLVMLGLRSIIDLVPRAAIVIGTGIAALGVAMLTGDEPVVSLPRVGRARDGRHWPLLRGGLLAIAAGVAAIHLVRQARGSARC